MWKKWANYRLAMRNIRQKYLTFLRRTTAVEREKTIAKFKKRFAKGVLFSLAGGVAYYYGNELYSEQV